MSAPDVRLRKADEADIPALAALWSQVFPGTRSAEERVRELRDGMTYGTLEDCRVVEREGRLAAALRAYRLSVHFRGRCYPAMGLAGVAVAPDFRRRGLGRRICSAALKEARERGDVLSLLYPFRVSFYRDLGYVLAGELHRYRFRPADLPAYEGWERVRQATELDFGGIEDCYRRVASRSNGMLDRGPGAWRSLRSQTTDFFLYRDEATDSVSGYVALARGRWKADRPTLRVRELVCADGEAYRALLGWVSVQRDQYASATYDASPSESFFRRLPHPRTEGSGRPRGLWFESARILRGPMLRVLDVGGVLASGGGDELAVDDPELPENSGLWRGGRRVGELEPDAVALSIGEVALRFLAGELPGQPPPPEGWTPCGPGDFRLLDEF